MNTLEAKQAAMRLKNSKPRRGVKAKVLRPPDDAQERLRRRGVAYLMLERGVAPALVASHCNRVFGTNWTTEKIKDWHRRGCPLTSAA